MNDTNSYYTKVLPPRFFDPPPFHLFHLDINASLVSCSLLLQLNIHRFKVIARFGLMHVVATNLCVWIRTLVLESIKEITQLHRNQGRTEAGILGGYHLTLCVLVLILMSRSLFFEKLTSTLLPPFTPPASIKDHTLRHAGAILGERPRELDNLRLGSTPHANKFARTVATTVSSFGRVARSTVQPVVRSVASTTTTPATPIAHSSTPWPHPISTMASMPASSTMAPPSAGLASSTMAAISSTLSSIYTTIMPSRDLELTTQASTFVEDVFSDIDLQADGKGQNTIPRFADSLSNATANLTAAVASFQSPLWNPSYNIFAEALTASEPGALTGNNTCGRVNIMGTIVKDSAPYLFPFIIEYSLIGAAVIYVMWKHIGRHPRWPNQAEADLERRLEAMLSRRAVALANAGQFFLFFFRVVIL